MWILLCAAGLAGELFTPSDLVDLRGVREVAVAPGAERVAWVVSEPRAEDDEPGPPYSAIHVAEWLEEGRPWTHAPRNAGSPRWSPDGLTLAFVAKDKSEEAKPQVFLLPVSGGEAQVLTDHEAGVGAYRWSPDGASIAFIAGPPPTEEEEADKKAGKDWIVVDEDDHRPALWSVDVNTGEIAELYSGEEHIKAHEWLPDGSGFAIQAAPSSGPDADMMDRALYTLRDGKLKALPKTTGKLGGMAVSPDSKQLAWTGATSLDDPLPQTVFVVALDGGEISSLGAERERSAHWVDWLDNRTLLALDDRGTETVLERIDVARGKATLATSSDAIIRAVSLDRDSGRVAVLAHGPNHPTELFAGLAKKGSLEQWTDHNPQLADVAFAEQEVVTWTAPDGMKIAGILIRPSSGEQPFPLVVNPHGGPEGVSQNGWNELPQLLAARGFAVLQPNYRGSGGRGVAFSKGDHDDLGGAEFEDLLAGIDHLVDTGIADADRVGIGGWSYGGYFSAWGAAKHSKRFKAAMMGAGIGNWVSFAGTTDIPREMALVHWSSFWHDEPDLHWDRSPVAQVDGDEPPTLIVHGAADPRVPPGQAREFYAALKAHGATAQLVLYPREHHGFREREHRIDLYNRIGDWFDTHLNGEE